MAYLNAEEVPHGPTVCGDHEGEDMLSSEGAASLPPLWQWNRGAYLIQGCIPHRGGACLIQGCIPHTGVHTSYRVHNSTQRGPHGPNNVRDHEVVGHVEQEGGPRGPNSDP